MRAVTCQGNLVEGAIYEASLTTKIPLTEVDQTLDMLLLNGATISIESEIVSILRFPLLSFTWELDFVISQVSSQTNSGEDIL